MSAQTAVCAARGCTYPRKLLSSYCGIHDDSDATVYRDHGRTPAKKGRKPEPVVRDVGNNGAPATRRGADVPYSDYESSELREEVVRIVQEQREKREIIHRANTSLSLLTRDLEVVLTELARREEQVPA